MSIQFRNLLISAVLATSLIACSTTSDTKSKDLASSEKVENMDDGKIVGAETAKKENMPKETMVESEKEAKEVKSEKKEKSDKKTLVRSFAAPKSDVYAAALAAVKLHGVKIKKQDENEISGKRSNKVGIIAGSGGEKIYVTLKEIDANNTEVGVRTKKTIIGIAMQKNWNDEIMDSIAENLE